jgi:hypothetical protein
MAAGDVVSAVFGPAALMSFQPAAGVEVCFTTIGAYNSQIQLTDGVDHAMMGHSTNPAGVYSFTTKLFVTNTIYLTTNLVSAEGCAYSGIQIK